MARNGGKGNNGTIIKPKSDGLTRMGHNTDLNEGDTRDATPPRKPNPLKK